MDEQVHEKKEDDSTTSHGWRTRATQVMRDKARTLRRRSDQLIALADLLDAIEKSAREGAGESDGRHPYVGAGSDAETALWEMACQVRTS